jgi:hypothetical protein
LMRRPPFRSRSQEKLPWSNISLSLSLSLSLVLRWRCFGCWGRCSVRRRRCTSTSSGCA